MLARPSERTAGRRAADRWGFRSAGCLARGSRSLLLHVKHGIHRAWSAGSRRRAVARETCGPHLVAILLPAPDVRDDRPNPTDSVSAARTGPAAMSALHSGGTAGHCHGGWSPGLPAVRPALAIPPSPRRRGQRRRQSAHGGRPGNWVHTDTRAPSSPAWARRVPRSAAADSAHSVHPPSAAVVAGVPVLGRRGDCVAPGQTR